MIILFANFAQFTFPIKKQQFEVQIFKKIKGEKNQNTSIGFYFLFIVMFNILGLRYIIMQAFIHSYFLSLMF
jgi:hypothetical protein